MKVELYFDEIDRRIAELTNFGNHAKQLLGEARENAASKDEWAEDALMPFLDALQGRLREIAKEFHSIFRHIEHGGKWSNEPGDIPPLVCIVEEKPQLKAVE